MIGFQDYLEAKAGLDSRSRSREVHAAFLDGLRGRDRARILDAGCGTGAMVRSLLAEQLPCSLEIIGLDRDAASLRVARERAIGPLRHAAGRAGARFIEGDLLETAPAGPFDVVMAHSFMDIVPLDRVLSVVGGLLEPGGLLYATLTYDGRTLLVPAASDAGFEDSLLEVYDQSMEDRRVGGAATGGSRAGARLLAAAAGAGFEVAACGASDWNVYPFGGRYIGSDAVFLQAILETMRAEGGRQGLEEAALDRWLASRAEDLQACRLGLIVHQIDLLARGPGALYPLDDAAGYLEGVIRMSLAQSLRFLAVAAASVTVAPLVGCESRAHITAAELRGHVSYLASDELGGRETGSTGVAQAERYIAADFARAGLKPLPGRETFFVDFALYRHTYDPAATALTFRRGDAGTEAELGVTFRPFWFSKIGKVEAPVVFAGYGITAPEHNWDDYQGLDTAGRIVLVLRHEPGHDAPASPFGGKEYTRHALFVTKARNALAHGAAGIILFTDPASGDAGADDLRVSGSLSLERTAGGSSGGGETLALAAAHISQDLAATLFGPSGYTLEGLQKAVDSGTKPRDIALRGLTASLSVGASTAAAQEVPSRNVAGWIRGSDPRLANEWIVIGAHHDHLGTIPQVGRPAGLPVGDRIFNGADDNASGTSGVLELAERFAAMRPRPARSLVFVTFSGEEEGLFGSTALFEQALIPRERIRFMVNLDMIGRNAEQAVRVFGQGVDEKLRSQLEASAEALDLKWTFAGAGPNPANSDYGPFMEAGIPFLSYFTGEHADYHEVSDHADRLEYRRMEQLVRWVAETVQAIASP